MYNYTLMFTPYLLHNPILKCIQVVSAILYNIIINQESINQPNVSRYINNHDLCDLIIKCR